jgi:hypothetical protein
MDLPGINSVTADQPFRWLRAGAQDLLRAWPLSLFYGVVVALLGYGLLQAAEAKPHLGMALISGFLFRRAGTGNGVLQSEPPPGA